jgi:DivIVA domain-containing protein
MKLWKKDKAEETGGFDAAPSGAVGGASITPMDVQAKKFRRSSRPSGGYVMREVDEFLDEVTDTLSALVAENERLRLAAGAPPTERAASVPARDADDRAAVDAFLQREKTFLQDLGGLVQTHAMELKSMVRSARASGEPAEASPAPAPTTGAPAPEAPLAAATAPAAVTAAPEATTPPVVEDEPIAPAAPVEREDPIESPTDTADADVVGEEPIRLEEPEPARSGPAEDQDRSLRELFWGEE